MNQSSETKPSEHHFANEQVNWAERLLEHFASVPLVHEFVFRGPQYLSKTQKEVCDFLIVQEGSGILVSLKAQEENAKRTENPLEKWLIKKFSAGASQAKGGIKTVQAQAFWCDHPRRGTVQFEPGSILLKHAIVLSEFHEIVIDLPPDQCPLHHRNVPITYLSLNDFCNLLDLLRSYKDIEHYLNARTKCSPSVLLHVGDEKAYLSYFLLRNGSFPEKLELSDLKKTYHSNRQKAMELLVLRKNSNKPVRFMEYIADALSIRRDDLPESAKHLYDEPRQNYLIFQAQLSNLSFAERCVLGERFLALIDKSKQEEGHGGIHYCSTIVSSQPHMVFVFVSCRGKQFDELVAICHELLTSGLSHYGKPSGLVVADVDGKSFHLEMIREFTPSDDTLNKGRELFGKLRHSDQPFRFGQLPE